MAKNQASLELSAEAFVLPSGEKFIKYDNKSDKRRIIIFGSEDGSRLLSNSKWWISDGTFDCAPTTLVEKFHQFYVYHGEVHDHTFPLLFVLMEHRNEKG